MNQLTQRQIREIDYHRERAALVQKFRKPITYEILQRPHRRWWNHHWSVYAILLKLGVSGKSVLIPGCGEGHDAIRLGKLGADVHAFDISPDMLSVARNRAGEEGVQVDFREMAAEQLKYGDDTFDVVFARDVLHHCDLARCLPEFRRVVKPGGFFVFDELYTHHLLQGLRESAFGCWLRSKIVGLIYPYATIDVYVTEDERKLTDYDLRAIKNVLATGRCRYFSMIVDRFLPSWNSAARLDRIALKLAGPAGSLLGGRFVIAGQVRK
jgi:ubiquinone/menaquinone biosynthesis C-methylase UbiE